MGYFFTKTSFKNQYRKVFIIKKPLYYYLEFGGMKMEENKIGEIVKFYDNLGVAIVKLYGQLNKGDRIHVVGSKTDFEQEVDSMELNNAPTLEGKMGDEVGIKLQSPAKEGDVVLKVYE